MTEFAILHSFKATGQNLEILVDIVLSKGFYAESTRARKAEGVKCASGICKRGLDSFVEPEHRFI